MALHFFPSTEALASMPVQVAALPLDLRILDASASVEAAETVWAMRARDLEARPSEQALRLARWAGEELREALDALEALRAEARA
jgi:hypothetical protein